MPYRSPVFEAVVFFTMGIHEPASGISVPLPRLDVVRVKSYENELIDPACVAVRYVVLINELCFVPKLIVYFLLDMVWKRPAELWIQASQISQSCSLILFYFNVNFTAFTGKTVNYAILLGVDGNVLPLQQVRPKRGVGL